MEGYVGVGRVCVCLVGGGGNWMERQLSGRPSVHITRIAVNKLCTKEWRNVKHTNTRTL